MHHLVEAAVSCSDRLCGVQNPRHTDTYTSKSDHDLDFHKTLECGTCFGLSIQRMTVMSLYTHHLPQLFPAMPSLVPSDRRDCIRVSAGGARRQRRGGGRGSGGTRGCSVLAQNTPCAPQHLPFVAASDALQLRTASSKWVAKYGKTEKARVEGSCSGHQRAQTGEDVRVFFYLARIADPFPGI